MDTSLADDTSAGCSVLLRVLVVVGALVGFTPLAVAVAGAANASEGSPPPNRPGLLDRVGGAAHSVLKPVGPVLTPVTELVRAVTSQVAPAVKPVTRGEIERWEADRPGSGAVGGRPKKHA